jgi:hypothetical protein
MAHLTSKDRFQIQMRSMDEFIGKDNPGALIFVQCLLIFELLVNNVFIEVLEGLSV